MRWYMSLRAYPDLPSAEYRYTHPGLCSRFRSRQKSLFVRVVMRDIGARKSVRRPPVSLEGEDVRDLGRSRLVGRPRTAGLRWTGTFYSECFPRQPPSVEVSAPLLDAIGRSGRDRRNPSFVEDFRQKASDARLGRVTYPDTTLCVCSSANALATSSHQSCSDGSEPVSID